MDDATTECRVHFAELDASLTLVIVAGARRPPDEDAKLEKIRGYLRSRKSLGAYLSFFGVKEHAHLSMLSYVHQFPGLVHFVVVDRSAHRLVAPSISELFGQRCDERSEELAAQQRELIRSNVWRMCSWAQKLLISGGHSSSLIKQRDFTYYYLLTAEDADGKALDFDGPLVGLGDLALDTNCYAALAARHFAGVKGVRLFELYGVFLSSLSAATLKRYSEILLEQIKLQHFAK